MKPYAYYNDIDPFACEWLRNLIKADLIMDGEVDERSIADVQADDLRGFTRWHFFAGIAGWERALQLAGWPEDRPIATVPVYPVSPFQLPENNSGKKTNDTSGRSLKDSLMNADFQRSAENKLRELLSLDGSMEYTMRFVRKVTPSGLPYSQLVASQRRTSGKDCGGWPTASSRDWKDTPGHGNNGSEPGRINQKQDGSVAEGSEHGRMGIANGSGPQPGSEASEAVGYGSSFESTKFLVFGTIPSGGHAQTAKPGESLRLNPIFHYI
jgi:hypothetical protein